MSKIQLWTPIVEFPTYEVSSHGLVINTATGRRLSLNKNQNGVVYVGISKNFVQYKRSVALLVAQHFLNNPYGARFDTPVHLNGNLEHNFVDNLVWRPRPFATSYKRQFSDPFANRLDYLIKNDMTGEVFVDSFKAATKCGVLERAVVMSVLNKGVEVFPDAHTFSFAE